jgi:polyphosphate glucokinase
MARKTNSRPPKAVDAAAKSAKSVRPITLSVDIGGSGLKAMLLDPAGNPLSERQRIPTPAIPTPAAVLKSLDQLRDLLPRFDRISVGFPGVVKHGTIYTAANLHPRWALFPLQDELQKHWKKPARVTNDAAVQGYGAIRGHGVELTLTLGTGLGSSLFTEGRLCPGLELAHHPWKKQTYEDYVGRRGLDRFGKKRWNKFVQELIDQTEKLFNWDHLYLGGGNTKKIEFRLPKNITMVSNREGILGGVALWREQDKNC